MSYTVNKNILQDPIKDIWKNQPSDLDKIFKPKTVAVIGASETLGSVGRTVLNNLIKSQFGGVVYPVNPNRNSVLGIKAYPSIKEVPDNIELAVVVTNAALVPKVLRECTECNIPTAIVISAGFKEMGPEGVKLENQISQIIKDGKMRIIGPNCLGVMNPISGLNATFACQIASPGKIAFISQSGALCTAVLDWSIREKVGFSAFVSIGSMLDVGWGDLIDYFGNDPRTESIIIYMESVGNARDFLSAAREVSLSKPIIIIKAGRTEAAAKAAASHTGSLTGSDDVLDEAFKRAGVLRVNEISELFDMSEVLAKQPLPLGPNLTIVTNAGGPGVLATDALILAKGKLTELSEQTYQELNKILPPHWSHNNPIDILGDASAERYAKSLEIAANDPNSNGLLVILTPQDMSDPLKTAELLCKYSKIPGKPLIASWMGGPIVAEGIDLLNKSGIPTFAYPDRAAKAFMHMWSYSDNLSQIYQVPTLTDEKQFNSSSREIAEGIIKSVQDSGRNLLSETESKNILAAYGIPTVKNKIAGTVEEAIEYASEIGYPVVLKLHSETITHKSDIGGVKLNIKTKDEVATAFREIENAVISKARREDFLGVAVQPMIKNDGYELILGSSCDQQFGPVLLFGLGGQLVEVFKDRALAIPPLNSILARRLMQKTKIYQALLGVRGKEPVDLKKLENILVRFSQMVLELKDIIECDINPLTCSSERIIALDARFLIKKLDQESIQASIRPYPIQYIKKCNLKDGAEIELRPLSPEDLPAVSDFHTNLSEKTVRSRYRSKLELGYRISAERLRRICFIDYERELAFAVKETNDTKIIAIARLSKSRIDQSSIFSLIITDTYQNRGLGKIIIEHLRDVAKAEGLYSISGIFMTENVGIHKICKDLGFTFETGENNLITATIIL